MTNWPQIIKDLEGQKITLYKIALMVGKQYHLVKRWKGGSEPKHSDGEKLLSIHAQHVPR